VAAAQNDFSPGIRAVGTTSDFLIKLNHVPDPPSVSSWTWCRSGKS
jgi:hypothetical protein